MHEMITMELPKRSYGMQIADIWSSGVILYAMLYGKYPFDAKEARFARKIVTADYKLLSVRRCPEATCAQADLMYSAFHPVHLA